MEYASALVKLKPGSEAKLQEWRTTIAARLDEAAATLADEDVKVESFHYEMMEAITDSVLMAKPLLDVPRDPGAEHSA